MTVMRLVLVVVIACSFVSISTDAVADTGQVDEMSSSSKMSKYKESLPASRFVLIAYAIVWCGLFFFLLSLRKRQIALDGRIAELESALARHDGKTETPS